MPAPIRQPTESELQFFRRNPNVPAYAAPDNKIVYNPFVSLSAEDREALYQNESARIFMRLNDQARPNRESFKLTQQQQQTQYPPGPIPQDPQQSLRETIAARALSNDPSAGAVTPEQQRFVEELKFRMLK